MLGFYLQAVVEQPPYPYGLHANDVQYVLADLGNALNELSTAWLDGMENWVQAADLMLTDLRVVADAGGQPKWIMLLVLSLMCFVTGGLVVGLGCLQLKGCGSKTKRDPEEGKPPPAYIYIRDRGDGGGRRDLFSDLHVS